MQSLLDLFIETIDDNDEESFISYLEACTDVNAKQPSTGKTVLHHSCVNGRNNLVSLLLQRGVDLCLKDKNDFTACDLAVEKNHDEILTQFAKFYSDRGFQPLFHVVSASGHYLWLRKLILSGEIIDRIDNEDNRRSALHYACLHHQIDCLEILLNYRASIDLSDKEGFTALHLSTIAGNTLAVQILLEKRAKLNKKDNRGRSALHYACLNNNLECLKMLIEKGCDVNLPDVDGKTALYYACEKGYWESAEILLNHKADLSIRDLSKRCSPADRAAQLNKNLVLNVLAESLSENGLPLLHNVCSNGHSHWLNYLLQTGLDIEMRDNTDRTALHHACLTGQRKCISILLRQGAQRDVKDLAGHTPLDLANQNGHDETYYQCVTKLGEVHSECAQETGGIPIAIQLAVSNEERTENELGKLAFMTMETTVTDIGGVADLDGSLTRHRGIFLLINNHQFPDASKNIPASQLDVDRLVQTFTELKYEVRSHNNLTVDQMREEFHSLARDQHIPHYDSFVCALLSHGDEGYVMGSDGREFHFSEAETILKPKADCPHSMDIAKVFIIEACRGNWDPKGFQGDLNTTRSVPESNRPSRITPDVTKCFYLYATVKNYKSIQNCHDGSYFIKCLCNNISNSNQSKKIFKVFLRVNAEMENNRSPENGHPRYQIGEFSTIETRNFSFEVPEEFRDENAEP